MNASRSRYVLTISMLLSAAIVALSGQAGGSRQPAQASRTTPPVQWPTYGGNLASQRYSALDQINKDNFAKLQIAWRFKTNNLGPTPDGLYSSTPLMVNDVLYTTAGTRRAVIALNPGTGEMLWKAALGGQVNAGPMSYAVNGKQYVAIAAGNSLFAFALP